MHDSLATHLPPLRRKIFRTFFAVAVLYGILGTFFLAAVFLASGVTPKILHVNYDSISAANQMREALLALHTPVDWPTRTPVEWQSQFEKALHFEETNITEKGEDRIAGEIRRLWDDVKDQPSQISKNQNKFSKLNGLLSELISVNEEAMFHTAEETVHFRNQVLITALLIFLTTIFTAIFLADSLAHRIASPIKDIAEALRGKSIPGEKLKLPIPTSLEIRILVFEFGQLWKRLSELRKLNIEEIAIQRTRLEIVLEAVEDAILVVDSVGAVLQCNRGLAKIVGIPLEMITGSRWNDLPTSSENYLVLRGRLTPQVSENEVIDVELEGVTRSFVCRCREIRNRPGDMSAILYLLHDVTEKKQRDRLKSEFIAVLSHELKTPLQSLGTAAELLMKRREELNDEGRMLIETIAEDTSRISAVAEDFMQVSFVDPHTLKLKISLHPLSELIQEWVKPFRITAKDKQVTIEFLKEGPDVIWANIDAVKFPWVVSNLLSNAIRFSPPHCKVQVRLSEQAGAILISISDEGPGIPESLRKRMFDPYFQAHLGEASTPTGFLGLGLTIAKEVVEAHGGKIRYYPGTPSGSIFEITLPHVLTEELS